MADKRSNLTLSDLVTGRQPVDYGTNLARAAIGQGLGMGWGDEAEAWLRTKLGEGNYERNLAKIRSEYGQFSKENPFTAGAAEFAGGAAPGVAMMFVPGMQTVGAGQLQRSTLGALGRLAATGAATGAISGAGSAKEGERLSGAGTGAAIGATLGVAIPVGMRTAKGGAGWLRERLAPTESLVNRVAAQKMSKALADSKISPSDLQARIASDRKMGVPSVLANVDESLADLAETVAQRPGAGSKIVEKTLRSQKTGARERAYQQTVKGLKPGQYYADEQRMVKELRDKADNVYEAAYAHGTVDDPRIMQVLENPAFKNFFDKAKSIADTEAMAAKLRGEDPSKYKLQDIYEVIRDDKLNPIGVKIKQLPDVRTLDYIKRGIDATIDSGFKGQGMSKAEANALRDLRKVFVGAIDENVPAYQQARKTYAGDIEVLDAMRTGYDDFNKLDHEQVINLVSSMGNAEKEAFRTGVARNLYSKIMNPSGNFNAAERIINSPEMAAKLQPLFDNPGQFKLFKAAMQREAELFHQANKILGGSPTSRRIAAREALDETGGMGEAVANAVTGGFWSSLTQMAAQTIRRGEIGEKTAEKLSKMLMSKKPEDVATVVKFLEDEAKKAAPKAVRATGAEYGATTGASSAIFPSPAAPEETPDITKEAEAGLPESLIQGGPDIEADLESESKR